MNDEAKFFEDISVIVENMNELAKPVLPEYKNFAKDVIFDRMTDIYEIERMLDYMVTFCFNNEILLLFKAVLRKLYYRYPDVVNIYVTVYFDMYGRDPE